MTFFGKPNVKKFTLQANIKFYRREKRYEEETFC